MSNHPEPPRRENIPSTGSVQQALANLTYLWKCDDPEWVAQREADWENLVVTAFDDYTKKEKKELERYFKYGEKSVYLGEVNLFFLTPYDSAESLLQLFNSRLLSATGRGDIYMHYIFTYGRFANCSFHQQHFNLFVNEFFREVYCEVFEQTSRYNTEVISPPPTFWCKIYISHAISSLSSRAESVPLYDCVNYFISILPFALDADGRKQMKLAELLQLVTEVLADSNLSGSVLAFAREIKDREAEILQAWKIGEQKMAAQLQES